MGFFFFILQDGEEQQCGFNVLFIYYQEIREYINTTLLCLNLVTVQLPVLEHEHAVLASVNMHILSALPTCPSISSWSCLLVRFQLVPQDGQTFFLLMNGFHDPYLPPWGLNNCFPYLMAIPYDFLRSSFYCSHGNPVSLVPPVW